MGFTRDDLIASVIGAIILLAAFFYMLPELQA
jgi:uncharacterized membrane protein YeaQ/YmgE (transglycosylase-associated protein family)